MSEILNAYTLSGTDRGQVERTTMYGGVTTSLTQNVLSVALGNTSTHTDYDTYESFYLRFPNITVPAGSTIRGAKLTFTAGPCHYAPVYSSIYFNNADNPPAPASVAEYDALSLTSAITWNIGDIWTTGDVEETPELNTILQTVINRAGWASGNAVLLVVKEVSNAYYTYRYISGLTTSQAYLTIEYSPPYYEGDLDEDTHLQSSIVSEVENANKGQMTARFDSPMAFTIPTGYKPFGGREAVTYEPELSENVTTDDDQAANVSWGEGPTDHEGELSENLTTDDFIYGQLPGDTDDPRSGYASDSFTMDAAITVETSVGEMDENVTMADEITGQHPHRSISEGVSLSDAISVLWEEAYASLSENLTTSDYIESPLYGELDEDVTTADAISAGYEFSGALSEGLTTSESISATKDKEESISETLSLYDTPAWGWGVAVADTIDITDAVSLADAWAIEEILTFGDTALSNWTGSEEVVSSLRLFGQLIIGEIFNETATSGIDITDAAIYLHQMVSAISDTVDFAQTLATQVEFNPVIAEAVAISGAVAVLANLYNANSETIDLTDVAGFAWAETVSDTIDITDSAAILWYCMNALTDSIELTEAVLGQFQINDTITDAIEFAATLALNQILTSSITDTVDFGIVVELDDELWECWVLNTNAFHASVYSGFSFNSYAVYNNTAYACKSDGIFKLSGSQDDGAAFKAGIVLPDTHFGTTRRKKFRKAYFGLSGGVTPSLRVETDSGSKTYTISDSKANITRDMYGKEWVLKVQDFDDLDFIELVPLVLSRK